MKAAEYARHLDRIMATIVYTGVGPYPRIVSDEDFVDCGVQRIKEIGAERYLLSLIHNLREDLRPWTNAPMPPGQG